MAESNRDLETLINTLKTLKPEIAPAQLESNTKDCSNGFYPSFIDIDFYLKCFRSLQNLLLTYKTIPLHIVTPLTGNKNSVLTVILTDSRINPKLRREAVLIIGNIWSNICNSDEMNKQLIEMCLDNSLAVILSVLQSLLIIRDLQNDLSFLTLLTGTLSAFQSVLDKLKYITTNHQATLLGTLKSLVLIGLTETSNLHSTEGSDSALYGAATNMNRRRKKRNSHRSDKQNIYLINKDIVFKSTLPTDCHENTTTITTKNNNNNNNNNNNRYASDSSDGCGSSSPILYSSTSSESEVESNANRKSLLLTKARLNALVCLQIALKKLDKKFLCTFWSNLLPDGATMRHSPHTLLTLIQYEQSYKVRASCFACITAFLEGSRVFLRSADDSLQNQTPFTSLSQRLASMLHQLHEQILKSLGVENHSFTLTQVLKCITVLIDCTPYNKLKLNFISKLCSHLASILKNRDTDVVVGCLSCTSKLLSVCVPLQEVVQLLDHTLSSVKSFTPSTTSLQCIIYYGIDQSAMCNIPVTIRVECIQLLMTVIANYPTSQIILHTIPSLLDNITSYLKQSDDPFTIQALKLIDITTKQYGTISNAIQEYDSVPIFSYLKEFWCVFLIQFYNPLSKTYCNTLLSHYINCLSSISQDIYAYFVSKNINKILLIELLKFARHESQQVVGSALKAISTLLLYPCVLTELSIVHELPDLLMLYLPLHHHHNNNNNTRIKAFICLSSYTEALTTMHTYTSNNNNNNNNNNDNTNIIDHSKYIQIMTCLNENPFDNRISTYVYRSLGYFLYYFPIKFFKETSNLNCLIKSFETILNGFTKNHPKSQWNACYAIGNIYKNESLRFSIELQQIYLNSIYSLTQLLNTSQYFKVKITALNVLSILNKREYFFSSELFIDLFIAIIKTAPLSLEGNFGFTEFKYRGNLMNAAFNAYCSLTLLFEAEDLKELNKLDAKFCKAIFEDFILNVQTDIFDNTIIFNKCISHILNFNIAQFMIEQRFIDSVLNKGNF